jgi:RNA polymerase sigma-70 factor (ECF subfamily)
MAQASAPEIDDQALAARASQGDRLAYGELVRRHSAAVRALLRRMGADPATADDIAQDAFVTGYQHIADFRAEGSFAGWIKRTAARLYIRRARSRLRLEDPLDDSGLDTAAPREDADLRLDLDAALRTLSEPERLCVSLCHGAGMAQPEIAEALRLPLGTVKSHVKRGLDKLRLRLGAEGRSGDGG